ncbi:MAG: SCO family protein, partial [Hyphomicrobiales bacterium]|nr:SCO family protein [Hyphomicrobiales bacterium]
RVYYRKVPLDGGDYTMDHSAFVYLMGKDGGFRSVIGYQEKPDRALDKLKTLIEKG